MSEQIISYEEGAKQIDEDGIKPLLNLVETKERHFFRAEAYLKVYDKIFRMCTQREEFNHSEKLYQKYCDSITQYLRRTVRSALDDARGKYTSIYMTEWKDRYENHQHIVSGLSKAFIYLDRYYTKSTDNVRPLVQQGYKIFEDEIFKTYCQHARDGILRCVNAERDNEEQDRVLLRDCINVFVDMGFKLESQNKLKYYKEKLEDSIVGDAGAFYQRYSETWLEEDCCSDYLKKAEAALSAEKKRVEGYLNRSTEEPLIRECYTKLLKVHQNALLTKATGLYYLLEEKQHDDLKRLFKLYVQFPKDLSPIGEMFRTQVQKEGQAIVKKANDNDRKSSKEEKHELVTSLITLHRHYNGVVKECFSNHQVFQKALKTAFESFINENDSVSKLLALFAHDVLKKGSKVGVTNVSKTLDHVVFLYGYIRDKDIFDHDYQQLLQERLLKRRCSSEHEEKAMISKLKSEAGYQWTNKLEGMFKDVGLSKDLTVTFGKSFNTEKECGLVFNVNVCTHGFWPTTNYTPNKTPDALKKTTDQFKNFYLNRFAEREIQWRMDMGEAEVLVNFNPKTQIRLSVSSYQMAFLLVFNQKKVATFEEILKITGLKSDANLQNHLLSLAHPRVKILLKRPSDKTLDKKHKFMLNANFKCRLKKITVPVHSVVRSATNPAVDPGVAIQRRAQTDAAIVRAMKTKKRMQHMQLVNEVTAQLQARFRAQPAMIKKRIEHLIEQEYLERDPKARGFYKYLA